MKLDLSETEKKLFLDVARENAEQLTMADIVLAHDPQAVALRHFAKDPDRAGWVWRCHIDLTNAHQPVWSFLRPFVEEHDASIWTMPEFVRPDLKQKVLIQAPTIDPFSEKNRDMPIERRARSCTDPLRSSAADPPAGLTVDPMEGSARGDRQPIAS